MSTELARPIGIRSLHPRISFTTYSAGMIVKTASLTSLPSEMLFLSLSTTFTLHFVFVFFTVGGVQLQLLSVQLPVSAFVHVAPASVVYAYSKNRFGEQL